MTKYQGNPGNNQGNQQNNHATPWIDQDVVVVSGKKHPVPRNTHKFLPKFDPNSKQQEEDHIKAFMMTIGKKIFQHEDVICIFFPYTFKGKATTWYFAQSPKSIVSWEQFETVFLEKFGDDKPPNVFVTYLYNMKMEAKEKVKYFNVMFPSLKNKIPVESMPAQNPIFSYCVKALPHNFYMWVKRAQKHILMTTFEEALVVVKHILSLNHSTDKQTDTTSSSSIKLETPKKYSKKKKYSPFDLESLQKAHNKLSNLKKNSTESSSNKSNFRNPSRKSF